MENSTNIKDYPCLLASIGLNIFILLAFKIHKLGFSDKKFRKNVKKAIYFYLYLKDGNFEHFEYFWISTYSIFNCFFFGANTK